VQIVRNIAPRGSGETSRSILTTIAAEVAVTTLYGFALSRKRGNIEKSTQL
jgi:hypothetical protein